MSGESLAEAPPCAELLADALEALEAGRFPAPFALEELAHFLEGRPSVARELLRRRGLRVFRQVERENPGASIRTVAGIAARRFGEVHADTLRRWGREAVEVPQEPPEAEGRTLDNP